MLWPLLLWLLPTLAGPGDPAVVFEERRIETAPDGSFSVSVPRSWRTVPTRAGDYTQLGLYADRPFQISVVVGARPLRAEERALDRRRLLDRMIEQTMINTVEVGNEILHVGRIDSLVGDWPAFAAVATDRDRSKIMTTSRSFDDERAYVVTTLTDNLQGSPELGATVTEVVGSLSVHPPRPPQPRFCDCW